MTHYEPAGELTAVFHVPHVSERVTALMLSGSLILGSAACSAQTAPEATPTGTHTTTVPAERPVLRPTATSSETPWACDEPTAADKIAVEGLFKVPLPATKPKKGENITAMLWRVRKEAAERNGLHIVDPNGILEKYETDLYKANGKNIPLTEYQMMAERFLAQYGVSLVQPTDTTGYTQPGISPFFSSAVKGSYEITVKQNYINVVRNIAELPIELVKQIALTEVVLVNIQDEQLAGFAETGTKTSTFGRFYVDPAKELSIGVFTHELFHLWDKNQCPGPSTMMQDPSFVAMNPAGAKTYVGVKQAMNKPANAETLSVVDIIFSQAAKDVMKEWEDASLKKGYTTQQGEAFKVKYDSLFKDAVVTRGYGLANPAEDKATMGEELLSPYVYPNTILAGRSPAVRKKAMYLFARMHQDDPRIVTYFNEVGNRTVS